MSIHQDAQLRNLIFQFGRLKRHITHLETELAERIGQPFSHTELPYSNIENDKYIKDIGLRDETVQTLRKNDIFMVSQILDLGSYWINATTVLSFGEIDEIRMRLADMGIELPE